MRSISSHPSGSRLLASLAFGAVLATSALAWADVQPASATATTANEKRSDPEPKSLKTIGLELNPLAATIGRYSVQVEWMPLLHHAIVLNPHFDHVSADVTSGAGTYSEGFTGFGGELGYRFYTGQKGLNGFFVGPSFLFGTYSASADVSGPGVSSNSTSFTTVGAALDVGGQAVIGPGILIGGGFGLQYTKASSDFGDLPLTASILAGGGVRPRFLLSAGYAF